MSRPLFNYPVSMKLPQHKSVSNCDPLVLHSSKLMPAISAMEPDRQTTARLMYSGRHNNGEFRLLIDGAKFLVNGAIYVLSKGDDHNGKPVWLKLLLGMTPGYRIAKQDELSFDVICESTGARMLVMGQARPFTGNSSNIGGAHV